MMIQRPFSSGSRQAPDPHDTFLEENGFYRKHTARDSSCLFRTVSEQVYDTQNHHLIIRQSCVDYMRKNKEYFKNCFNQYDHYNVDFDDYLIELSKLKTFGTMLELEAMAYMFSRNVRLFRPMDRGSWFIYKPYFERNFEIFITHDRHFDTVYTTNFIEDAAFCQSIVYELLYKKVFQLPDITYAVERMLHSSSFDEVESSNDGLYCRRIQLKDGRSFDLDPPETTCCILNNYELCHFHNPNFPQLSESLKRDAYDFYNDKNDWNKDQQLERYNGSNYYQNHGETNMNDNFRIRQLDALLPQKYISCVRQLLAEGITPFPYKVAKALDPDMYRNIEFDSWSEIRKEQRWNNWYTGGTNLQVGVKCQVYLKKYDDFFNCYIQEMPDNQPGPCVVFIEALGEKRTVSSECLKPLPSDQTKPWPLPYRWQKHFEKYQAQQYQTYSPNKFFKRFTQSKCKMVEFESYDITQTYHHDEKEEINLKLKHYCSLENFKPSTISPLEIIALPLSVEHNRTPLNSGIQNKNKNRQKQKNSNANVNDETPTRPSSSNNQQQPQQPETTNALELLDENGAEIEQTNASIQISNSESYESYGYYAEPYYSYQYDNSIIHATGAQPYYCMLQSSNSNTASSTGYAQPTPTGAPGLYMQPHHQLATSNLGYYPPPAYFSHGSMPSAFLGQPLGRTSISRQLATNSSINYTVQKSIMESGSDLPTDVATLQFFFNLGCDYYAELQSNKSGDTENDVTKALDFHKIKIEHDTATEQDKSDSNNNIIASNSGDDNINTARHYNQPNNNYCRNNPTRYNNNRSDNKNFPSRYFNNRKIGYNRGGSNSGATVHSHRYSSGAHSARGEGGGNHFQHSHSRNDNRYINNGNNKGFKAENSKNDGNDKNNNLKEAENQNDNTINNNQKVNKEHSEQGNQKSPDFITSENTEFIQSPSVYMMNQPSTSIIPALANSAAFNLFSDSAEQQHFSGSNNTNTNAGVPQLISPLTFGLSPNLAVPPPNVGNSAQTYGSFQPAVSQNPSYQYLTYAPPINTSHPPPPQGVPLHTTSYLQHQPSHMQQTPAFFYPVAAPIATNTNESGSSSTIGGEVNNMVNFTPEPTGPYPVMNVPVYPVYTPTNNNGGITPTNSGPAAPLTGSVYHQGYWLTPTPLPSTVSVTTPNNNINYNGNLSNISH